MAEKSSIEWTESSWNPVTGCSKISPGCLNCYAERLACRLQAMGVASYANGFKVTCHPHLLDLPLKWFRPRRIFVCSMSDLFHPQVPEEFIQEVFSIMGQAHQHTFQILTKRSKRLAAMAPKLAWTPNIWAGVTVESADYLYRISDLSHVPATIIPSGLSRWNHCLGHCPICLLNILTGLLLAVNPDQEPDRCHIIGFARSEGYVKKMGYRFSSSNGAATGKNGGADCLMAVSMTITLPHPHQFYADLIRYKRRPAVIVQADKI